MKVSYCEKCKHCKKVDWSSYVISHGYRSIGVPHTFAFCSLFKDKCLNIKKCDIDVVKGRM